MAQVILVIVRLRHRVVDGRIRKGDPSDNVRPVFLKGLKIHNREDYTRILPIRFSSACCFFRRFGWLRQFHVFRQFVIGSGALSILVQVADHQKSAAKGQ